MKPHKRQNFPDDPAACLAIMAEVKCVSSLGVIHECDGQISTQSHGHETVHRFVIAASGTIDNTNRRRQCL
jgi:hypothetical protein